ncbi:MAG: hypothetical protein JOZ10_14845 [Acidobacteria bacterium]|nr:hypothetical protein [Acidobacteriota bacterium]MBV9144349.1 hypothetical protein [Acidobacteriota bacterium]MBV9438046.1 hypothetical protein [Acidobacteriota bacterium]
MSLWSDNTHWTAAPTLKISSGSCSDEYRLREGHVEFRPARGTEWRELKYPDLQQHFALSTPVGRWLAQLYSAANLGKVLSN